MNLAALPTQPPLIARLPGQGYELAGPEHFEASFLRMS